MAQGYWAVMPTSLLLFILILLMKLILHHTLSHIETSYCAFMSGEGMSGKKAVFLIPTVKLCLQKNPFSIKCTFMSYHLAYTHS